MEIAYEPVEVASWINIRKSSGVGVAVLAADRRRYLRVFDTHVGEEHEPRNRAPIIISLGFDDVADQPRNVEGTDPPMEIAERIREWPHIHDFLVGIFPPRLFDCQNAVILQA